MGNQKPTKILFKPKSIEQKMEFGNRINELEAKYADEINFYAFCHSLAYTQIEEPKNMP